MDRKVRQLKITENDLLTDLVNHFDSLPLLQPEDVTAQRVAMACEPHRSVTNVQHELDRLVREGKLSVVKKRSQRNGSEVTVYIRITDPPTK